MNTKNRNKANSSGSTMWLFHTTKYTSMKIYITIPIIGILFVLIFWSCTPKKEEDSTKPVHIQPIGANVALELSIGQTVYVPAYSQIYSVNANDEDSRTNLAVTLSIRNTDLDHPIVIKSVKYYDNDGTFLKEYVEDPFKLASMASVAFRIRQADTSGGVGANYIVEWGAEETVFEPYIEAIMIGSQGTHAFSWRSTGYVMKENSN